MKKMKTIIALLIAMVMVLGMSTAVFAAQTVHGTTNADNKGKITISNATVGKKYGLYKLFDATVALNADGTAKLDANGKPIISYTVPTGKTLTDNAWFQVDTAGNVTAKTGADITTDAFKTWAQGFGTAVQENVTASDSELVFDQLEFGYYFITSEVGAVITVDSTTPQVTVIDKNQTFSIDKNIVQQTTGEGGATQTTTKANNAKLGEDVPYEITVSATNYDGTDKIFKYVVYDTIDNGMTYKAAPTVKVGNSTLTSGTDYTVKWLKSDGTETTTIAEAQKFEIEIKWTADGTKSGAFLYSANETIKVNYTAFLDPNKKDNIEFTGTSDVNTNKANVKVYKGDYTTPQGELPDVQTDTFVTELVISKTDQDGKALQGAEFTLSGPSGITVITKTDSFTLAADGTYYLLNDGTYTTEAPNGDEDHDAAYASKTDKYKKETVTSVTGGSTGKPITVAVDANGKATFSGLAAGDYTLVESKVPAGYNQIDDISFTVGFTTQADTQSPTGLKGVFSVSNVTPSKYNISVDGSNNQLGTTIINQKGTELPSTGGIGTTIFYIIGAILVVGAGVVLVTRRRMKK